MKTRVLFPHPTKQSSSAGQLVPHLTDWVNPVAASVLINRILRCDKQGHRDLLCKILRLLQGLLLGSQVGPVTGDGN